MTSSMIILIIFFIFIPFVILFLEKHFVIVRKVGAVLICYGLGLVIGNLGILPDGIEKYQEWLMNITIPIALPLILFSLNVRRWLKMAGSAMLSLGIGFFTVILMVIVGYFLFVDDIEEIWKVTGMLVGVYTGGTPNMAAMKTALNVNQELYLMTHTYDLFLGAIYLLFILSVGQRVFLMFLPPFKSSKTDQTSEIADSQGDFESYEGIFTKKVFVPLLGAFGLSLLIFAASYGISRLFPEDFMMAAIILLITTFSITLSFVPAINKIKKTFQGGMYIILIFCLVVSSMADIRQLANISFSLFWFVALVMFGSHFLHALIAKFFRLDADTVIISGSALICSPPFVPVIAGALKNREVILTGLAVGIAGYAVGNYLGVFIAYLFK